MKANFSKETTEFTEPIVKEKCTDLAIATDQSSQQVKDIDVKAAQDESDANTAIEIKITLPNREKPILIKLIV